jgi:CubicO group peptidase (beta-lactamase class C family)
MNIDGIDAYIEGQMRRLNIPGAALAIVEDSEIMHMCGFGRARPEGEAPTPQTPFFIGSLTKSFTALAVMQLVEADKIELDAPVQRYLPWLRVADPQASARMTVCHLLNQTSGLPTLPGELVLADFDDRPDATERQVRALATLQISRPVGAKCEYSNLNYNILGLIVEAASGESYANYIQTHILDPLDMRHSYTSKAAAKQDGLAMGHRHWFSLPFPAPNLPVPQASLPSGQLISSAEDMAHYLIAHLNGGRYGDVQILSAAGIDELHRGAAEYVAGGVSAGRYGMGWFEIDVDGTKTYSHGGNVPDFSAFMALVPEQKRGVVVLFNADPYGLPPITEEVGMGVTALLAGQQPPPIRLDFVQWIMRLLPLIPLLQGGDPSGALLTAIQTHSRRVVAQLPLGHLLLVLGGLPGPLASAVGDLGVGVAVVDVEIRAVDQVPDTQLVVWPMAPVQPGNLPGAQVLCKLPDVDACRFAVADRSHQHKAARVASSLLGVCLTGKHRAMRSIDPVRIILDWLPAPLSNELDQAGACSPERTLR